MNDALRMQISAFVDGELPNNESELLLRRLSQDAALRQQVSRYLEIGRQMRRDRDVPGMDRLRGRIAAAIGDEVVRPDDEPKVVGSALMTPTTGVAVAATVAALALVGLSQLEGPRDPILQRAVAIDDGVGAYTEPAVEQALAQQPSEMMMQYYRIHGGTGDGLGTNGILALPATLELIELVEIDPDPRLLPNDSSEKSDESDDLSTGTP